MIRILILQIEILSLLYFLKVESREQLASSPSAVQASKIEKTILEE